MTQTKQRLTFEEYLTYDDGSDRDLSATFPSLQLTADQILRAGRKPKTEGNQ